MTIAAQQTGEDMTESPKPRQAGFTLVEMVVAVGLGAIIVAVVVSVFAHGSRVTSVTNARSEAYHNVTVALGFLERDIHSAFLEADGEQFKGYADNVTFCTMAEQAGESGATTVTYQLGLESLPDGVQVDALRRLSVPFSGTPSSNAAVGLGITAFSLRYFYDGSWGSADEWDSTNSADATQYRRLPRCIEVSIEGVDTRGFMEKTGEDPVVVRRLIALPVR